MVTAAGFKTRASVTTIVLGAVVADVLYCVGDQFGRDDLGVVRVLAQPVEAERGPDVQARYPH